MKYFLFLILFFFLIAGYAQSRQVRRISYATSTRGFSREVIFTPKTITIQQEDHRGKENTSPTTTALKKEDWEKLIDCLKNIKLAELPDLASPSMDRSFDGAMASTLTITTRRGKSWSHGFDAIKPHEKLQPLMNMILVLSEK